jgi:Uma2 family endonuclease
MVLLDSKVRIPDWVVDLGSFRRWATSDELPRHGRFSHFNGELWVDLSRETHAQSQLRCAMTAALGRLDREAPQGYLYSSRMLLTNPGAELSTEPDWMFVSWKAVRSERVRLDRGDDSVEVVGTPDMVLEIVSPFSVKKDTEVLRELYGRAGVSEYWLVDARREPVRFDLLRQSPRGYSAARPRAGWVRSAVFGKSFRLTARPDRLGNTAYAREVR